MADPDSNQTDTLPAADAAPAPAEPQPPEASRETEVPALDGPDLVPESPPEPAPEPIAEAPAENETAAGEETADAGEMAEPSPPAAAPDPRALAMRVLEAVLFAAVEPLDRKSITARLPLGADIDMAIEDVERAFATRGINLVRIAGKFALRTAPDLAPFMQVETTVQRKLSRAGIETLAIIAYHQPVTRAEIEEVRGVAISKGTLDTLLEIGWIQPKGHRMTPGRPATWVTTDAFLQHFGLDRIGDLPGVEELKAAGLLDARPTGTTYGESGALQLPEEEEEPEDDRPSLEAEPQPDPPLSLSEARRRRDME